MIKDASTSDDILIRNADAKPRVVLVAHDVHDGGGMERACAELIRAAHGEVRFSVVTTRLAPDLVPLVDRWVRVGVIRRPFALKFVVFFARAGLALRRLDADVVHTVGAIVPNRIDVASVHFCHAGYHDHTRALAPRGAPLHRRVNTGAARALALASERWVYHRRVRAFGAVSGGVAAEIGRHYPRVPVAVTPNGVDGRRFRPDPATRAAVRRELGIPDERCAALFVGGDWHRKGLAIAIAAAARARREGADIELWVVGDGDRSRFAGIAGDHGAAGRVRFLGRRDDTERLYRAADVFVLPSEYEAFPLVCIEAASCGLPLVIPGISGAAELVGGDEAGLIVERDPASVASALVALARDPRRRAALGAAARRRAGAYTWDVSAASVLDLYRSLRRAAPR